MCSIQSPDIAEEDYIEQRTWARQKNPTGGMKPDQVGCWKQLQKLPFWANRVSPFDQNGKAFGEASSF